MQLCQSHISALVHDGELPSMASLDRLQARFGNSPPGSLSSLELMQAYSLLWMGHTVTEQQLKAPGTQTDVLLADLHHCRPAGELTAASAPMPCSWCGQARLKWATWSTGASCNSPGCGPGPGPCPAAVGSPGPLGSTGCRRATPGEAQAQGFPSPLNCTHGYHLS